MAYPIRWGILAPGAIAHKFAAGLESAEGATLVAVGSRSEDRARAFAEQYGAPRAYDSYEQLVADPEVDAIYIASRHTGHMDHALLCIEAGKPVLCEKPFTVNEAQAQRVVDAARANGVFCMEAMWTRFHPAMAKVRELIANGAIGEVRLVQSDFAFRSGSSDPQGRLLNPDFAGGGLLDVGVYCVSFTSMVLGEPAEAIGLAHLGETGVDEQAVAILKFGDGQLAELICAIKTQTAVEGRVYGTEGWIHVHSPFHNARTVTLHAGGEETTFDVPPAGNGYGHQAEEVAACLEAGKIESDLLPLDESLAIMRTMDRIRASFGLTYPCEP